MKHNSLPRPLAWLLVVIVSLAIIQFYVLQYRWWWGILYSIVFVIIPLLQILRKLYFASATADFHRLSNMIKAVMLAGILSMIFFKMNTLWIA